MATTRITLLYDNEVHAPNLRKGWGFACLIQRQGETVLFDTAWNFDDVAHNAQRLGVDLREINTVVISHDHWDHIGGLPRALSMIGNGPRVLLPSAITSHHRAEVARLAKIVESTTEPQPIGPGISSTGELGGGTIAEQAILVDLGSSLAVITGCAHPGLGPILQRARTVGEVSAVIGGFHGFDQLDDLDNIPVIVPCHCTRHKTRILEAHSGRAQAGGSGRVIEWP